MRITTWNVNGLRAALRKGFEDRIAQIKPDVLLLQEVRALPAQLPGDWAAPKGWHVHWHPAEKKGYAGTAVWSKKPMQVIGTGVGKTNKTKMAGDPEGRLIHVRVDGVQIVSLYLPSGSSGEHRQAEKEKWMKQFAPWAAKCKRARQPMVLGGDFNIAHTEQDIFYAKSNSKNSGFLPHERLWMGDLLKSGWHDFVREQYGDCDGPYTWWSNRGQARKLDRGWRIDYLLGNAAASKRFKRAIVHREESLGVSDHSPVSVDLS